MDLLVVPSASSQEVLEILFRLPFLMFQCPEVNGTLRVRQEHLFTVPSVTAFFV